MIYSAAIMPCPDCGSAVPGTARFCPSCGSAVDFGATAWLEPEANPRAPESPGDSAAVVAAAVPAAPATVITTAVAVVAAAAVVAATVPAVVVVLPLPTPTGRRGMAVVRRRLWGSLAASPRG